MTPNQPSSPFVLGLLRGWAFVWLPAATLSLREQLQSGVREALRRYADRHTSPNLRVFVSTDLIPNGVDLDLFHPIPQADARRALGWFHTDPVVVFMDRRGAWVKDPELAQAVKTWNGDMPAARPASR